jgi:hypothetical protein
MTDGPDTVFERRFEARLRSFADIPVPPVDADAVAAAVGSTRPWWPAVRLPALPRPLALVLLAAATALALAGAILAAAALRKDDPLAATPVVVAFEDGLYLVGTDRTDRRLLRDDGSFMLPAWSPSGDRIAVIHGPPLPGRPATGVARSRPEEFRLEPHELLVLDAGGSTVFRVRGAIRDLAWGPAGTDGQDRLAVGLAGGELQVLDGSGRVVTRAARVPSTGSLDQQVLGPPGLAWDASGWLLYTSGPAVRALDPTTGRDLPLLEADAGVAASIAARPGGGGFAYVDAPCAALCGGHLVEVAWTPGSIAERRTSWPLAIAGVRPSWTADGRDIVAWPSAYPSDGGPARRLAGAASMGHLEVAPSSVRVLTDTPGRLLALTSYAAYEDRRFDAWVLAPDGTAARVGTSVLGFDERPGTQRAP